MYIDDYTGEVRDTWNGLFRRGSIHNTPKDHLYDCKNVLFSYTGSVGTRGALAQSYNITTNCVRQFLSTINSSLTFLHCDGAGNIYANNSVLYSRPNLVDFAAINIGGVTYIAPIYNVNSAANVLLIYNGTTIRSAGVAAPSTSFAATEPDAGNVTIGVHKIAVSFVTTNGFTTQPGPKLAGVFTPVSIASSGSLNIRLTGIPTGPAGTTQRIILVTKANLDVYYHIASGIIYNNTATTLDLDFRDTDLAVSADSLFDVRETIPVGWPGHGGMALQKYHNRLFVIGGSGDIVLVSDQGNYESFNSVTGMLNIPTEGDGNSVRSAVELYDVLYLMKGVGIFSVADNGKDDPSSWQVVGPIEGAVGAYSNAIGSITQSIPGLTTVATVLLACKSGVFMFNGAVQHPALTWKIQTFWDQVTPGTDNQTQLCIDPFLERIYVLVCLGGATTPNTLFVGSYRNGLNRQNIAWTIFEFPPNVPRSIAMLNFNDGIDYRYYLRLSMNSTLYKLTESFGADLGSRQVISYIQTGLVANAIPGKIDIFRFLRYNVQGIGTLIIQVTDQAQNQISSWPQVLPATNALELSKEINHVIEAVSIKVYLEGLGSWFVLYTLTVLHKDWIDGRPRS